MNRIEDLRKCRNVNEVVAVVKSTQAAFKRTRKSISSGISVSANLVIDHRDPNATPAGMTPIVQGFKGPAMKDVKLHSDAMTDLMEQLEELRTAESLLRYNFTTSRKQPAALKAITALREDVEKTVAAAHSGLDMLAQSTMPAPLTALADGINDHLVDTLDTGDYSNIERRSYVVPHGRNYQYCTYLEISDLKDSSGYQYEKFYIIATCEIDTKGNAQFHVNALPQFKAPGTYPPGKSVSSPKDAINAVDLMLANNNFIIDFKRRPFVDLKKVQTSGVANIPGVEDIDIVDDRLVVKCSRSVKTQASISTVVQEILRRVGGILSKSSQLRYKTQRESNTVITVPVKATVKLEPLEKLAGVDSVATTRTTPKSAVITFEKNLPEAQIAAATKRVLAAIKKQQTTTPAVAKTSVMSRILLEFVIVQRETQRAMTLDKIAEIADDLGLDDNEVRALRFALQNRARQ